ncbi:esterase-like activity of phytase family protein [Sphingobium sp.]|uniref:esterase-like activity of phytase family protein n=1 Tax=Sphingobium sp. TaxID=1912891 RepID=UPI002BC9AA78|nr:esterase-like activity of phytase family protein [Sphingobium sp.]HUD93163.1 esterase-like activity of phytase family protein [Sphingobium sp.]
MTRILIVLALAILLLPAPPPSKPQIVHPGALLVTARPLALNAAKPEQRRVGGLDYLGGWELRSDNAGFGGISALLASPNGDMLGLSDSGILMGFHVGEGAAYRRPFIAPLPIRPQDRYRPWWAWDSESLTHDPETDRYWVGFELQQAICRYSPGFAHVEGCRTWPEIVAWPETGSIESLARLPDGRFIAIGEMGMTSDGRHDVLLFPGDPADHGTANPIHLRYAPPQGYRPTDAVALDERHLLVLNRRLTLQELFTATIAIVDLPEHLEPGALLKARTLAHLAPPLLADNFEGMAVTLEKGRPILWVVSDDNHEFFQRTLLLKFGLDRAW